MLILTRSIGQSVELILPTGGTVRLTVNAVRGRRVLLAFEAPAEVRISRPEAKGRTVPIRKAA